MPVTVTGRFRLGDIRHNYADMTKINKLLDFRPKMFFAEGIAKFTVWVLEQEIQEDKLSASLDEMKKKGLLK